MLFRSKYQSIKEQISNDKIVFLVWPRQVGKTTILKNIYEEIGDVPKIFLNMENREYHESFQNISQIISLITHYWYQKWKKFYLFLDEFHIVKWIDRKLKTLFDDYKDIKIFCSGSNNIIINSKIQESFAGRKRIINIFPLSFMEYILWKFGSWVGQNDTINWYQEYTSNPLNQNIIQKELENILIWWSLPEIVLANTNDKKEILKWLYDNWLYRDIFGSIKTNFEFVSFMKHLSFANAQQLNIEKLSIQSWVSSHTIKNYIHLLEQTFAGFAIKPFFQNKLKEIIKTTKFYFLDNGFRNLIINRFDFSQEEYGGLFEWFVFGELLKLDKEQNDIKYRRTANWSHEVDFVLEWSKTILEAKYKKIIKTSDYFGINAFDKEYPDFQSNIINKTNFFWL